MTAERFDVFVVGSSDPSPAAQSRLATAVASRHGAPLATVAQAIAEKRLRAGSGLDRAAAESLAHKLQGMGALTAIRAAASKPAEPPAERPAGAPASLRPLGSRAEAPIATPYAEPRPRPGPPAQPAPEPDPFAPPPSIPIGPLSLASMDLDRAPASPSPRRHDLFTPAEGANASLELDLAPSPPLERTTPVAARSLPGASGLDTNRLVATSSASGLAIGEEEPGAHAIRCPRHGLLYDRRRADGCRRCLEDVRAAAQAAEGRLPSRQLAALRESPARRAFLGLGFALFLGFLPAAYHAFRPGADEVRRLRAEQDELSHKTGTEDNLRRFDEIDELVAHSRSRAARNTFILWFAVSGVAFVGWYRIT
jgi:hypothetical protein